MSDRDHNVQCDRFPGYPETERESRNECDERQWDSMSDRSCARADRPEQQKLTAEIIDDMRGYLEISGIHVSKPRRIPDQADGLREAMMGIARSQGALAAEMVATEPRSGMEMLADAINGIRDDLREIGRAS